MFRTISITAVCLILVTSNCATAQKKPFKNKMARAAKKSYEEAIANAKKEYLAKLDVAIKEAGAAGDIDEANRLVAEKKEIGAELDPVEKARKRIEGTRWGKNAKSTVKFYPKRKMIFAGGYPGVWIMSGPRTLLLQSSKSSAIAVWKFDTKMTSVRSYRFVKSKEEPGFLKKIR